MKKFNLNARRDFLKKVTTAGVLMPFSVLSGEKCVKKRSVSPEIKAIKKIDLHMHISSDAAYLREIMNVLNFKMLTINNEALKKERLRKQQEVAIKICSEYPRYYAWCTTFPLNGISDPDWLQRVKEYLQNSFDRGALAVKIWKEIGMQLKDPHGNYLQIDNPVFDPVLDFIESKDKTLMAHIGDPVDQWLSFGLDGKHNAWYREDNTEVENRIGKFLGEVPYDTLIRARDHMIETHPELRVIGCHLGSMAHNLDEVAERLEKYPNFAVEISYSLHHVKAQAREKVRSFFIKYQDRIMYGSDKSGGLIATPFLVDMSKIDQHWTPEELSNEKSNLMKDYQDDYAYLSTDMKFRNRDYMVQGLALPGEVLRKVYYGNAVRWIPGIDKDY